MSTMRFLLGLRDVVLKPQARLLLPRWHGSNPRNFTVSTAKYFPICTVDTNLNKSDLPSDLAKDLCKVVAQILNKPIDSVTVTVRPGCDMYRRGSDSSLLSVHIWSIGVFDSDRNVGYSKALYNYLQTTTKLPADRICVLFHPIERHVAGHLLYEDFLQLNKIDLHK